MQLVVIIINTKEEQNTGKHFFLLQEMQHKTAQMKNTIKDHGSDRQDMMMTECNSADSPLTVGSQLWSYKK